MRMWRWLTVFVFLAACSGNQGDPLVPAPDAGVDAPRAVCGDGVTEGNEQCDDGNHVEDDDCTSACRLTCGDGALGTHELCDTAIAAGQPGACPTSCDDHMACTTDTLAGTACQAKCTHAAITAFVNGDGCCPPGGNGNNDHDCPAVCGNDIVEPGETCDTHIAAGSPGACPTSCDDHIACTTDALAHAGTCQAACTNTPVTTPTNNDGCCPPGANIENDNDCTATCGDGVVTPPETCDTTITAGHTGACPTSCDDGISCTSDSLLFGGTCSASCQHTAITTTHDGDGCCPAGANATTDSDCPAVCGNGIVEPGETCDDGGRVSGDGCSSTCQVESTGMRMDALALRDPHVYVDFIGCNDVTNDPLFTFAGVNPTIATNLGNDGDGDGLLDLSPVLLFKPLRQASTAQTALDLVLAGCTAPASSTSCSPHGGLRYTGTASNQSTGVCLDKLANTTYAAYTPAWSGTSAPCFSSDAHTITVTLSGIPVTLQNARLAAVYSGNPATGLVNGLLRGFISEADADTTLLPSSLPLIGGQPLSSVLPGGKNNCASHDDRDLGPDGSTKGWYFYLNFTAKVAPWSETP